MTVQFLIYSLFYLSNFLQQRYFRLPQTSAPVLLFSLCSMRNETVHHNVNVGQSGVFILTP